MTDALPCNRSLVSLIPTTPEQWVAAEKRLTLNTAIVLYQHGARNPAGLNPMPWPGVAYTLSMAEG